jgi:hypothetical protein
MSFVYESNDASMVDAIMRRGGFSYRAAKVILEREQETAEQTQEPIKLDPVALRGMWAEYKTAKELAEDLGYEDHIVREDGDVDPDATLENIEHHEGRTIIRVNHDGPFLINV